MSPVNSQHHSATKDGSVQHPFIFLILWIKHEYVPSVSQQ